VEDHMIRIGGSVSRVPCDVPIHRERRSEKRSLPLLFLSILFIWGLPSATAAVIGFDDLDATAGDIILDNLNPYQGFTWTNFSVYTYAPGFPGFNNGIVSAPNAAYTVGDALGSSIVSTITAASSFDFISAYLGSGWYDGMNVTVDGLLNGTQEFSQTVTVNTEASQLFTFNFNDITELDIFSQVTASTSDPYGCGPSGCSQITLDDLTFAPSSGGPPPPPPPPSSTVPEPTSLVLMGLGLAGFSFLRLKSLPIS
jgi:hypothetical protein